MASIFPQIGVPDELEQEEVQATYGKELAFDFATGEYVTENGRIKEVEGIEALKIWIERSIRTARYRWPIHSFDFGSELEDIIGLDIPVPVLESEVKRVITDALMVNEFITAVRDFVIERGGDWLRVTFTVDTSLDDTFEQGVMIGV